MWQKVWPDVGGVPEPFSCKRLLATNWSTSPTIVRGPCAEMANLHHSREPNPNRRNRTGNPTDKKPNPNRSAGWIRSADALASSEREERHRTGGFDHPNQQNSKLRRLCSRTHGAKVSARAFASGTAALKVFSSRPSVWGWPKRCRSRKDRTGHRRMGGALAPPKWRVRAKTWPCGDS